MSKRQSPSGEFVDIQPNKKFQLQSVALGNSPPTTNDAAAAQQQQQQHQQQLHAPSAGSNSLPVSVGTGNPAKLSAPILHNVPKSALPILHHPLKATDFFGDLEHDLHNPKVTSQINSIIKYFPPPAPNFLSPEFSTFQNGMMIPFIYPPPPPPPRAPSAQVTSTKSSKRNRQQNDMMVIPPLPFPPPNYMPYPLVADQSTLSPNEVFQSFLDASAQLPRIDMVLASAAGSLYDMKSQANEEGFTITGHEGEKERLRLESAKSERQNDDEQYGDEGDEFDGDEGADEENDVDNDEAGQSGNFNNGGTGAGNYNHEYEEYKEFASQVDTSEAFDKYDTSLNRSEFELRKQRQPGYGQVNSQISNVKNKKRGVRRVRHRYNEYHESPSSESIKSLKFPISSAKVFSNSSSSVKDNATQINNQKDKRVSTLLKNMSDLKEYEAANEEELYLTLKRAQLKRLKDLNESKLLFNGKEVIHDEELNDIKVALEEKRDIDLVGLKLLENYELLNHALVFYQDSNKSYKQMNSIMINKLMKLKNFFEYQRDFFNNNLDNEEHSNFFDIKTKDAGKIYAGISQKDVAGYLREELKLQEAAKEGIKKEADATGVSKLGGISQYHKYTPTSVSLVHDFMPLITENEFNLITGGLPNHKFKSVEHSTSHSGAPATTTTTTSNVKHQIFKSPLYDPITSGSDTNGSESSTIVAPKRRGRRAANSGFGPGSGTGSGAGGNLNGGTGGSGNTGTNEGSPGDKFIDSSDKGNSKYSETLLLARIMKHYVPPQGARQDELLNDLESMGVQSKWPITK